MEANGADIIEIGCPFTDPLADGKAIQDANNVSRSRPAILHFLRHLDVKIPSDLVAST